MPSFEADPTNFAELLEMVRDGSEISLKPGDYKGPFIIDRAIAIRGSGGETVLFAVDEPAVAVKVPGVRLENLTIARTVGGETGEVALLAESGTLPTLQQVRLTGRAENVRWSGASWDIPAVLDFGEIPPNRQIERDWELQLGSSCQVLWDADWLQVRSTYLSPGWQTLKVAVNSRSIPPGTELKSVLELQEDLRLRSGISPPNPPNLGGNQLSPPGLGDLGGKCVSPVQEESPGKIIRTIEIVAKISSSNSPEFPESLSSARVEAETTAESEIAPQTWGYRFMGSGASDNLIRIVEGQKAIEANSEYDRRDRAKDLLGEILGKNPRLFYLRRLQEGENPGEEKWELTLATDIDSDEFPQLLAEKEKTLQFIALVNCESGNFALLSARLVNQARGKNNRFSEKFWIRFRPRAGSAGIGVPREAIALVEQMPFCQECLPTEKQLEAWKVFLKLEERMAQARQFCVAFQEHNYGAAPRNITFTVNAKTATVDPPLTPPSKGGEGGVGFLDLPEFWQRVKKASQEDINLLESKPDKNGDRVEYLLGSILSADAKKSTIRIRLDADLVDRIKAERYQLPRSGFLSFEAAGDLTQVKRKKRALSDLQDGRSQNPYLGQFLFDASQAKPLLNQGIKLKHEDLLLADANPEQIAAVETVLSAPDLVLIQGPPGTGKTTVIAEICYQVALRGERTLITSQSNLAVDNALSRLIHSPVVRALRKGRAARVEDEGLPFLEENAIGNWLKNTADDCENNLAKHQETRELLSELLKSAAGFTEYIELEEELARYYVLAHKGIETKVYKSLSKEIKQKRKWWQGIWTTIPDRLKPPIPDLGLFDLQFLRQVKEQFDAWQTECDRAQTYLNRYESFVTDWITKLRNPSERDIHDLKRIYIDKANALGVTCSQAAGYDFKDYKNFDVVIIDEVSKCTPPELLMPALKGEKVVLIGDYLQLPPMLHEHSLEEIAEELESTPEELSFLGESLFKKQFAAANDSIKCQLTIQYRMHPSIMAAINQFYDHSLKCGILEPDRDRAHELSGTIVVKPHHHLMWIKMPKQADYAEQREGTSYFNVKEIEAIDLICQDMEDAWSPKVTEGKPPKDIGIITFYGAQLRRIEEMLDNRQFPSLQIRTGTVDRFQCMERDIVIVSLVRNNSQGKIGFARKPERVNVAFSRARQLLVIVGCHELFTQHSGKVGSMYSDVADIVNRNGGLIDVSRILS